jgi:hypothetical protein
MKKAVVVVLVLIFSISSVMAADYNGDNPEPIQPEYIAVLNTHVQISLSSGKVLCSGSLKIPSGYTVSITWKLQRTSSLNSNDYSTIETWTDGGAGFHVFTLNTFRFATHGHVYRLVEDANVYRTNGSFVENVSLTSSAVRYP